MACAMGSVPLPVAAQSGGFLLGRIVTTEGSDAASTGFGAIDTGATSSEVAVLLEGRWEGLEWRVRGQTAGDVRDFPGDAAASIQALSYSRGLTDTLFGSIGKQQRMWGTGVAYQPLGFFRTQTNLRDPTDAEGRGVGLPMIVLTRLADPVTIDAVVADDLQGRRESRQWALRGSGQAGAVEWSALARQRRGATVGFGASGTWAGERIGLYGDLWWGSPEPRRLVDDRAVPFAPESGIEDVGNGARRVSFALGLNYTPVERVTYTVELDRRGEGLNATQWREFIDRTEQAAADIDTPRAGPAFRQLAQGLVLLSGAGARQDYLFQRVSWSGERVALAANLNIGLGDGGFAATGTVSYPISSRTNLLAAATRFGGHSRSEYGLTPVRTVVSLSLRHGFDL